MKKCRDVACFGHVSHSFGARDVSEASVVARHVEGRSHHRDSTVMYLKVLFSLLVRFVFVFSCSGCGSGGVSKKN